MEMFTTPTTTIHAPGAGLSLRLPSVSAWTWGGTCARRTIDNWSVVHTIPPGHRAICLKRSRFGSEYTIWLEVLSRTRSPATPRNYTFIGEGLP